MEEVISRANKNNYGLAAAVFTKDVSNALFMSNRLIMMVMVMVMLIMMMMMMIMMMLSMLVVLMPRLIVIESITFDLSQNSLRAGTVWVNCYDVLEAQVMIMINIFNDDNDNQTGYDHDQIF